MPESSICRFKFFEVFEVLAKKCRKRNVLKNEIVYRFHFSRSRLKTLKKLWKIEKGVKITSELVADLAKKCRKLPHLQISLKGLPATNFFKKTEFFGPKSGLRKSPYREKMVTANRRSWKMKSYTDFIFQDPDLEDWVGPEFLGLPISNRFHRFGRNSGGFLVRKLAKPSRFRPDLVEISEFADSGVKLNFLVLCLE